MNRKVFGASVIWLPPTSSSKYGKVLVCGGTSWMEVSVQALFTIFSVRYARQELFLLLIILSGPPFNEGVQNSFKCLAVENLCLAKNCGKIAKIA